MNFSVSFTVAIALNLCLTGVNLYVLWKMPRWRRKLRDLRQKLTAEERRVIAETEQARQAIALLPTVKNDLIARKQRLIDIQKKLKLIIQLYQFLASYKHKFLK